MAILGLKLALRFVLFGGVFFYAKKKMDKVEIQPWWALPLVALMFALLNLALYYAGTEVIKLASMNVANYVVPVVVNCLILFGTTALLKKMKVESVRIHGIVAIVWLAILLSIANGLISLGFHWFG